MLHRDALRSQCSSFSIVLQYTLILCIEDISELLSELLVARSLTVQPRLGRYRLVRDSGDVLLVLCSQPLLRVDPSRFTGADRRRL